MAEELICPICGETLNNTRHRGSHMWNKHQIKYSEYVKGAEPMNESTKCADGLIKPSMVKESKEFVNEPAVVIDKELMKESERTDTDFVKTVHNPYRDLYMNDQGTVLNEWLH